jgi:HEAT repeat protein
VKSLVALVEKRLAEARRGDGGAQDDPSAAMKARFACLPIAEGFAACRIPAAADALLGFIADADPAKRAVGIAGAKGTRDPRMAKALLDLVADPSVGPDAVDRLATIHPPGMAERLIASLKGLPDSAVPYAHIAIAASRDPLGDRFARQHITDVTVLQGLGMGGCRDGDLLEPLSQALRELGANGYRAGSAMCAIGGEDAVRLLVKSLRDGDDQERESAAFLMIRDPRPVEPLIKALADADAQVRMRAADSLAYIGDPRGGDAIVARVNQEKDRMTRRDLVEKLALSEDPTRYQELFLAIANQPVAPDWQDNLVRRAAISGLGRTHDPRLIDPLLALFHRGAADDPASASERGNERMGVAQALADIPDPRVVDALIELGGDRGPMPPLVSTENLARIQAEPWMQADASASARIAAYLREHPTTGDRRVGQ